LCIKLVIETSLYYDARSEKHQIRDIHVSILGFYIENGKTKDSEMKDNRHPPQRLQHAEKCKYKLRKSFLPILLDKITV